MATVVFFRAVNVGGHQRFQPGALARELAAFGVTNVGAAGTFVVRGTIRPARLRAEILSRLPYQTDLMICPAREVLTACAGDGGFREVPAAPGAGRFVSVLAKTPHAVPPLPLEHPEGAGWEIRIAAIRGRFVLSLRRPGRAGLYPNAVVEKRLGLPATTRGWNTFETILEILATPGTRP